MGQTESPEALDRQIAQVEANMRELTEEAAAASGAASEEAIAGRIEDQQAVLDALQRRRRALGGE